MDAMVEVLNTSIGVEESGLQFISENDAVTIASTNGLAVYHLASLKVLSKIELNLLRIPLYWKFSKSSGWS